MMVLTAWNWLFHLPCLFHELTGLYCPGCGGTRAVRYLLQGELGMSFCYHPFVLYGVCVAAVEAVSFAAAKVFRRPEVYVGRESFFLYVGLAIVLVNWIIKNLCLVVFGIDLLK